MIKCNSCNLEKNEEEFSKRNDGKNIGKYRKTCKECKNKNQRKNYYNYKKNNPFLARHTKMKASCKQRNIPYNLDEEYLEQIWTEYCPISGIKLEWPTSSENRSSENVAELDRFIPELGYIKGNVSWVSRRMNNLKSNASVDELEKILNWMKSWKPPELNAIQEKVAAREPAWNKGLKYSNSEFNGENNPASKLTLNEIIQIRNEFDNSRGIYVKLSKKYNVSTACIRKIVKGKTWKD